MNKKYRTLFGNTIIFAIGNIGSKIITFLLVPLYTNVLTRDQYGTADLIMTCSFMIVPLISVVIQDSVLRFGLSKNIEKGKVALNALIVFFVGSIIMIAFVPFIGLYKPLSEWKWYLAFLVITNSASNIIYMYAKVKEQNKLYAFASVIHAAVLAIVNIILLVFVNFGVRGYLLANIFSNIIPSVIVFIKTHILQDIKKISYKIDKDLMKNMIMYSFPLIANSLSWWVLNSSDRLMIQHYMSTAHLGLYTAASKIPALLSVVTSIFSSAWTISSITEYDSDKDKTFYSNVFSCFGLVMHVGAALLIMMIKPFMMIYVGKDFFQSWSLVPLLLLGAIYYAYSSFFGAIYGAVKKNFMVTITTIIAATVNISVNWLLIPRIGLMAASISTAMGYIIIGIYRMINSRKYFSFYINFKKMFLNFILLLIQTILVTCNAMIYFSSVVIIILLLLINKSDIYRFFLFVKSKVKNERLKQ